MPKQVAPQPTYRTLNWGRTRYRDALARQQVLVSQRMAGAVPDTLVLTEHQPVFTLGARPGADQHLVWDEATRETAGVEVVRINRGGDVTYHGPGQLVGYAFLNLAERERDLHAYLRQLEEVVIRALRTFGLESGRREGKTGIWLEDRKIAAIGVAVKRWITYHGFALNVSTDLRYFTGIVPCGITDGTVTSMEKELGTAVDDKAVAQAIQTSFWQQFAGTSPK